MNGRVLTYILSVFVFTMDAVAIGIIGDSTIYMLLPILVALYFVYKAGESWEDKR